ncbi:Uncharacterised protein [Mycobacteroides abscessus subsp. abscessus]|nr:Uncharacterised protein [Mycobacteroides abscessus subsp. abscessus]
MKKAFNKFLRYHKSKNISSLIAFTIALSLINIFDYQSLRNNPILLLPFLVIVLAGMILIDEVFNKMLRKRNIEISIIYFYISIFSVVTVTTVVKYFT